ncbi:Crp/Fnr family transcriptional regulator [Erythrobacter donghaensis]|nr:helix-turn-helix domain-containing protein [Erythrobacter donghaensis]
MAHLICEAHYRLSLVDPHQGQQIYFPLTQDDLADVLGLTPVHINRKLQQLRQEGLITLRSKQLTIHDLRTLQQIAGFDPSYLAPRVQTLRERERLRVIAA